MAAACPRGCHRIVWPEARPLPHWRGDARECGRKRARFRIRGSEVGERGRKRGRSRPGEGDKGPRCRKRPRSRPREGDDWPRCQKRGRSRPDEGEAEGRGRKRVRSRPDEGDEGSRWRKRPRSRPGEGEAGGNMAGSAGVPAQTRVVGSFDAGSGSVSGNACERWRLLCGAGSCPFRNLIIPRATAYAGPACAMAENGRVDIAETPRVCGMRQALAVLYSLVAFFRERGGAGRRGILKEPL